MAIVDKPLILAFIVENSSADIGDYETTLYDILMRSRISEKRLKDLGIGDAGLSFNPHFLLNNAGRIAPWLVKRLRAERFPDPQAKFQEYEQEHSLFEDYFGRFIPETHFLTLNHNFDSSEEYIHGKEYVMFQEFIDGISLKEASQKYGTKIPDWLRTELSEYIACYRIIQKEAGAIPDSYSVDIDQVIVDEKRKRIFLTDTNNPNYLGRELQDNELFRRYYSGSIEEVTSNLVHGIFERICVDYDFDPNRWYGWFDKFNINDARAIQTLTKYFPRDYKDNEYISDIVCTFGLSEIANQ